MKKIFLLITIVVTQSLFAHPSDREDLSHLGEGTKLIFTKDLNIVANSNVLATSFRDGVFFDGYDADTQPEHTPNCSVVYEPVKYDRVLPKGTTLVVRDIIKNDYENASKMFSYAKDYMLEVEGNKSIIEISCSNTGRFNLGVNISNFKKLMDDLGVVIELPAPVIMR